MVKQSFTCKRTHTLQTDNNGAHLFISIFILKQMIIRLN